MNSWKSCLACLPLIFGAPFAAAQDAEPARAIVLTHSLPFAEAEGPLPVTVYSAQLLQRLGANTPAEGLRLDPSALGNTATELDSNGGNGTARLSLRGLGPQNVVTLINGRRAFGFANLNAIPLGALDRVELLRDGAGLIYGADAVAGVANFILVNGPGSTPLNGVEIDLLYGNTTDKDARVIQGSIRGGFSNEKLSLAFVAEYYDRGAIFSRDREVSQSADRTRLSGNNGTTPVFPGNVSIFGSSRVLIDPTALPTGPASYRAYVAATDALNFRAFTPAIPAQEKYGYYLTGQYRVFGRAMTVYADLLYEKTKQDNGLAPAPFSIPLGGYSNPSITTIPGFPQGILNGTEGRGPDNSAAAQRALIRNSPFNPIGGTAFTTLRYRLFELGNRRSFYDQDYWRYTVGLKGEFVFKGNPFIDFLSYDGGFVLERADQLRVDSGDARRGLLYQEILAGNFNPFVGLGGPLSGTAPTYVNGVATGQTRTYDNVAAAARAAYVGRSFLNARDFLVDAKVSGNLFPQLFQGGLGFNLGAEYRRSSSTQLPDAVQVQNDQLGFSASPNAKYRQEVRSYFAEFALPIVTPRMKVPLVHSLDFSAGLRFEEYEYADQLLGGYIEPANGSFRPGPRRFDSGVLTRYTLRYQPFSDLTLRGSYSESYRPPAAADLFAPQRTQVFDPASFPGAVGPVVVTRLGGNPNLRGEESTSWTAGLAYAPRQLRGLTLTVDYYQTRTGNLVVGSDDFSQLVVNANGASLSAGAAFPGAYGYVIDFNNPGAIPPPGRFVGRLPQAVGGTINTILGQNANAGKRFVQGLESTLTYELPWERYGKFTLSAGAHYLFSWKLEPVIGLGSNNFLGTYNNGTLPLGPGAIPRLKGFVRAEWAWRGFAWIGTVNYIGEFKDDPAFVVDPAIVPRTVPSYVTFDTQISYEFKRPPKEVVDGKGVRMQVGADASGTFLQKLLWGTKIRVGAVNLFDRSPPTVLGAFNDNYDTSLYSLRNRYVYVGLSKRF